MHKTNLAHVRKSEAGQKLREFGVVLLNREEKMGSVNQHDGIGHDSVSMEQQFPLKSGQIVIVKKLFVNMLNTVEKRIFKPDFR